jgi:hypothetical protein
VYGGGAGGFQFSSEMYLT